jgi:uncharacterized membrane protein YbjE (DUF340 family)
MIRYSKNALPNYLIFPERNDSMLILFLMAIGVLIGLKWFPARYAKLNSRLQLICTGFLIFCMGVSLGRKENFLKDLFSLGWQSFVFAVIPIILSILAVYVLSHIFLEKKK